MQKERDRTLYTALVGAGVSTLIVVAALDVAFVPAAYFAHPPLVLGIFAHAVWAGLPLLAGPLGTVSLLCLASSIPKTMGRAVVVGLSPLPWLAYPWALGWQTQYVPGRVLVLALAAFGFAAAAAFLPRIQPRLRWLTTGAGITGFFWLHVTNETRYVRLYEPVHVLLLQASAVVLASALVQPALKLARRFEAFRKRATAGAALALIATATASLISESESHMRAHTLIGRGENVATPYTHEAERSHGTIEPDRQGVSRFLEHSHLPPSDVDTSQFDILFVTIEAVRFDATSLPGGGGSTPHLARLSADGWVFTNAQSPSTGTLTSIASLMTLLPPSAARITTWQKSWHGRLSQEDTTAAEIFRQAGRHTFWAGHNFKHCFSIDMLGLAQGFEEIRLVPSDADGHDEDLDERIATEAITALERAAAAGKRTFGWVFFASPHAPYDARGNVEPTASDWERYQSEVTHADQQVGRLVEALSRSGRLDETVIVVTSDHGEEFGEHRGSNHKSSAYAELRHVPLVVRLPGTEPRRISAHTSTSYLLPWLMLHGEPTVRAHAERTLANVVGPYLRATEGAVVVELLGHQRMESALVDARHSIIIDWVADHRALFDLEKDPAEQRDVWLADPSAFPDLRARADAYMRARAALRRYRVTPEIRSPR